MTIEQVDIIEQAKASLREHEGFVLCLALQTHGSSPRCAGTWMGVKASGELVGTIGGGSLEAVALREALAALEAKTSHCVHHLLSGSNSDTGMICGGDITLCYVVFDHTSLPAVVNMSNLLTTQEGGWLVLEHLKGKVSFHVYDHHEQPLKFVESPHALSTSFIYDHKKEVFIQRLKQEGRTYIFGGGHVGQAVAAVCARAGFSVVVIDDRPGLISENRYPTSVCTKLGSYTNISASCSLTHDDAVIITTAGHRSDLHVAEQALKASPAYIGCLGSSRKTAFLHEKLLEKGFSPSEVDSIHMPVGIAIGAEGPEEIAISIAAELIAWRHSC